MELYYYIIIYLIKMSTSCFRFIISFMKLNNNNLNYDKITSTLICLSQIHKCIYAFGGKIYKQLVVQLIKKTQFFYNAIHKGESCPSREQNEQESRPPRQIHQQGESRSTRQQHQEDGRSPKEKHQGKAVPHARSIKEQTVSYNRSIKKAVPHVSSIKEKAISNKRSFKKKCYQHIKEKSVFHVRSAKEKVVPQESSIKEKSVPNSSRTREKAVPAEAAPRRSLSPAAASSSRRPSRRRSGLSLKVTLD